jgi:diguanylate cyclase (GGDEF)-like protein
MATILLVDERDGSRGALADLLREQGHRLLDTADCAEAKQLLHSERPDIVVSDVLMAATNGFPFPLRPRASRDFPRTRFILCAPEFLMQETRRLAEACGVPHVVAKPIESQQFLKLVSAVLATPVLEPSEIERRSDHTIDSHLGSISAGLHERVVELEGIVRKLDQRAIENAAQLQTARAALEQEVSKRLLAEEELTHAVRRLHEQAMRDPLTGLYNRRYLMDSFERELLRAKRGGERLGVMMIDLDHFKRCNDTYGHAAGDAVLRSVAKYMLSLIRGEDILCRYGGEEFVLVQAKATTEAVMQRAERFRQEVGGHEIEHDGQRIGPVTLSIGISMFPDHAASAEALLQVADVALYRAKEGGRNRVVMTEPGSSS